MGEHQIAQAVIPVCDHRRLVRRQFDVDRVGRAGPGAQLAADALLQPVGVPVELVAAVEAAGDGVRVLGVGLRDGLLEDRPERDAEPREGIEE